jgi:hypothetical protein
MNKLTSVIISAGLFPNERTVSFNTADGKTSVFVSSNQVDEVKKALNIVLLDQDDTYALVQIPSQSGGTIAKVQRSMVQQ